MFKAYSLLLGVVLALTSVQAQTIIPGGAVSGTWSPSGSPYLIQGDITVQDLSLLTIQPGVEVIFQGWYSLTISPNAVFVAVGNEADSITFTAANPDTGWHGIRFEGWYTGSPSQLAYCVIQHGRAVGEHPACRGGGIYLFNASPPISHCTITQNWAVDGGGISIYNYSHPQITYCDITNNFAQVGGGIRCKYEAYPYIYKCNIANNTAVYKGGGIEITFGSHPQIKNCAITNNVSQTDGGGIYHWDNTIYVLTLTNCTISENSASGLGGGIYNQAGAYYPTFLNSIIWNNSPSQIYGGAFLSYTDIQGGYAGTGNLDADPLFYATTGDSAFYLTADSPCIDAGNPASPLDPDSTRTDMGAYYYHQLLPYMILVPNSLDFGAIAVGDTTAQDLVISNIGEDTLEILSVSTSNPYFWTDFNPANNLVQPNASLTLTVYFSASLGGNYSDSLHLESNHTPASIPLVGLAITTFIPGGSVSGVWSAAGSPYGIVGSINVPPHATLTLEPGVELYFAGSCGLTVNGYLEAVGAPEDSIRFLAMHPNQGWSGLRFINAPDSSRLTYCLIEQVKRSGNVSGGGVYCSYANPSITHSTIRNNSLTAAHPDHAYGAGIYLQDSHPLLSYCNIENNTCSGIAMNAGAGIYCETSNPRIYHCQILNNACSGSVVRGGGLSAEVSSHPIIEYCVFSGNTAMGLTGWQEGRGGGLAFWFNTGSTTLKFCLFANNVASSEGGGIVQYSSGLTLLENCIIAKNKATYAMFTHGGGLSLDYSSATLINCTVFGNRINQTSGGGLYSGSSLLTVKNSIVWNNVGTQIYYSGTLPPVSYSDVQGGFTGTGNFNLDPRFVAGPLGYFYLSQIAAGQTQQSPCVDHGDPLFFHYRGTTRTDGVLDEGTVDIGAHYPIRGLEEVASINSDPWLVQNPDQLPLTFSCSAPFPNPFNASTVIRYQIPDTRQVSLKIYDTAGRLVATLVEGYQNTGVYHTTFDAGELASGIYLCRLEAGDHTATKKIVLIK